ncbi:MAG: redox-regulated ATPase YchF [Rhodospirillales bacterium]|nr:redox-regulated ATPase YchF [Alphaproteobacteria bacterium]USO03513.1 MAG: redox-regulated ATPase YchF [Rhodospirillales bacterium]
MGFNCGIVGLPNVGKSTLFNALTATAAAQAENFPFCTIEPNVGKVAVPDARLDRIAKIGKSAKIVPTQLEFVDIAGLVKGASKGEGLGNQFLSNIRETDAIIHVLRCFENQDITHVEGSIDPLRDAEVIETELMLADLESLQKQCDAIVRKTKSNDAEIKAQYAFMQTVLKALEEGKSARTVTPSNEDEKRWMHSLHLMTAKPVLYVCNVNENDAAAGNDWTKKVEEMAAAQGSEAVTICAAIESEIAQLDNAEDKAEFLESLGLTEPGLNKIIRAGYALLGLHTYFTVGPKEARAWTVRIGAKAPEAAGEIHTDFEKGFIKAEVISFEDYTALGGEQAAKDAGKMRQEGKDYVVHDGDLILFRFNV